MNKKDFNQMTFWEHLEELRWHLIRVVFSVVLFAVISYYFSNYIIYHFINNVSYNTIINIQVLDITSVFFVKIYISIIGGVLLSFPIILFEAWRFFLPALDIKPNIFFIIIFIVASLILIMVGIYFSYYLLIPLSITFFTNLIDLDIHYNYTLENYIRYVFSIISIGVLVFQLPLLIIFFNYFHIATTAYLKHIRKYVYLFFLFFGALLTPPDIFTQILLVFPLIILYEISILITRFFR